MIDRAKLRAAVVRQFEFLRTAHIRHPAAGGDCIDAYIGSALADAERSVLDLIDKAEPVGLDDLGVAWARVEAALPEGWLFHGVSLTDHSVDETPGGWGPDWSAAMSWPGHCEYDDCDHDEAYRVGYGPTPTAALLALAEKLEALG